MEDKNENVYVIEVNNDGFKLSDGREYPFPFEIENVPTVEEMNKLYKQWEKTLYDK
jgi:hypothetical protein